MRVRAARRVAIIAWASTLLAGCFSWEQDDTFGVVIGATPWGAPTATVTVFRRATLRLRQHYNNVMRTPDGVRVACSQSSWRNRVKCVRGDLQSAEGKMPEVEALRQRWRAALADDQLGDLNTAVSDSAGAGRCLTLYARIGWGDVGYNWTWRNDGSDRCRRGIDPTPGFTPAVN